ncbi:hypothetical protein F2Q68_00013210 [Brassica cretica]|uniref:Secretory carrier-associated membrane protein n=1 Tax=Brassica cretica TaxID=69181 RepID=A0A8S9HJJ2_BRACR|nr:hypothetical protein F2Q68_00013210 [Brassica cretica]
MAGRYDRNPFDEGDEVNPFANQGSVPAASSSRLSPLPPEPAGFGYGRTVDVPLDRPGSGAQDLKKKEKELQAKEAELKRREQNPGSVPAASSSRLSPLPPEPAGFGYGRTVDVPLDRPGSGAQDLKKKEKELQAKEAELKRREQLHIAFCVFAAVAPPVVFKGKSLAGILPALDMLSSQALVGLLLRLLLIIEFLFCLSQIFYFIGFAFFCLESVVSIWVIQQVYMYFRGSGKADEMKRDAARGAMRAAMIDGAVSLVNSGEIIAPTSDVPCLITGASPSNSGINRMVIGLSRPVPSRPAAGFSSGGTRRDAVLKLAVQSRTAKSVSLRGLSRGTSQKTPYKLLQAAYASTRRHRKHQTP